MRDVASCLGIKQATAYSLLHDPGRADEAYRAVARAVVKNPLARRAGGHPTVVVALDQHLIDMLDAMAAGRNGSSVVEELLRQEIKKERHRCR